MPFIKFRANAKQRKNNNNICFTNRKNCNLTTVRESWKESELIVKKNVRHLQATTYVKKVISGEGISKKYALFLKLLYEWLL